MFFLPPPPPHSHLPPFSNCPSFISPLFYTYTHLLPSFSHPPLPPTVSQPLPPYPHFRFLFILWLSPCYHPLFDIQLHCFPPPSPRIAHPIPLTLPVPPNPPFSLFHHFMDQIHY